MKNLFLGIFTIALLLVGCDPNSQGGVYVNQPQNSSATVTPDNSNIGDNLNLQALGELVKSSSNAKEIEDKLNQTGSINNLDLDGDGKVDYIKVTEYGQGNDKGFSFTVDVKNKDTGAVESQEVATVVLSKDATNPQQASMNIQGNQQLYGNNYSYASNYSMSDLLIMGYLFSPHSFYYSPWRYGYYPAYYHPYGCMGYGMYRSRMSPYVSSSRITRTTTTRTTVQSPNRSLSSSTVASRNRSLSNSTRSQKSFSTSAPSNSRPSTSGFGRSSSSSSSSRSSSSSSRSSSGRSSFGGSSSRSSSSGSRRSDARFKTNVAPLTSSLNKVCSLNGVNYNWKVKEFPAEKFDNSKQIGFIAQDLEKVYPEVVKTRPDGYKQVDYDLLVPALVEAIKELKTKTVKQDSLIKYLMLRKSVQYGETSESKHIGGK